MIRKFFLSFMVVFLLLALLLKLSGFDSIYGTNGLLSNNETLGSFTYNFLQRLNTNLSHNVIRIPKIPVIPKLSSVSGLSPTIEVIFNILTGFYNAIRLFLNGIIVLINGIITLYNVLTEVLIFVYTFFQVVFDYWRINLFTFGG